MLINTAERADLKDGEEIKVVFLQRHGHGMRGTSHLPSQELTMVAIHNPLPEVMKPHWFRLLVSILSVDLDTMSSI